MLKLLTELAWAGLDIINTIITVVLSLLFGEELIVSRLIRTAYNSDWQPANISTVS